MNMFSYYITTHFIPSNKDYNSYYNSHSMYQTYPYWHDRDSLIITIPLKEEYK